MVVQIALFGHQQGERNFLVNKMEHHFLVLDAYHPGFKFDRGAAPETQRAPDWSSWEWQCLTGGQVAQTARRNIDYRVALSFP